MNAPEITCDLGMIDCHAKSKVVGFCRFLFACRVAKSGDNSFIPLRLYSDAMGIISRNIEFIRRDLRDTLRLPSLGTTALVDISIPAGTLGLLTDKVTKFLFLAPYQVSHQEHLKRFQAGKRFEELGEFFEFDIHLECNHISNATVPTSFLILRNRSTQVFERVELLVEADGGYVKYQDFTTLLAVGETPLVVYLPRIPLKEIEFTNHNRIVTPYNKVTVTLHIRDSTIPDYKAKATSWPISPSYTEFLNSSWDKKWGTVWNLDYIESCKTDLRHKLQFYLVTRNRWPVVGESSSRIYRIYKILRLLLGMPLFRILSHEWVVSAIFWLPIFVRYRKLEPRNDG